MSFDLQGPGTVLSAGQKQSEFQVQGAERVLLECHATLSPSLGLSFLQTQATSSGC